MVQRYRFNYVQEMFETDAGAQYSETERGEWVKYEDYAALKEQFMDYMVAKEKQINTLAKAYAALTDGAKQ